MAEESQDFQLEVDGPDVHPETVEAAKLVEFVSAYLDLLQKTAADDEETLSFTGLWVGEGCVAVKSMTPHAQAVQNAAERSALFLRGALKPPAGVNKSVSRMRRALRAFPPTYETKVIMGPWEQRLELPDRAVDPSPPAALETFRARIERVGGKTPKARVHAVLEDHAFSLDVSPDQARKLGELLYRQADLSAAVFRNARGKIISGWLVEFVPVSDRDPTEAWTEWYRAHGSFWDSVEDIEAELGRRDRTE